jgi:hypothetical protein
MKRVHDDDDIPFSSHPSLDVTLVPGEPLRVAFRASAWTKFGLTGGSEFAGTAEAIWPDPPSLHATLHSTPNLAVGHEGDVDHQCARPCFSVTISVTRH